MLGAEVGEGVIIERHAAGQPLKGQFARLGIAAAVQFAGTTDAAKGGVQPQGALGCADRRQRRRGHARRPGFFATIV